MIRNISNLRVLSCQKSHMFISKLRVEEEPALNEGVFTVWRDPNTIDVYTAIFRLTNVTLRLKLF